MNFQTTSSPPQVAADENWPDAGSFSRPHSFSSLVNVQERIIELTGQAMREAGEAKRNWQHRLAADLTLTAAVLNEVSAIINEALLEEAKMNVAAETRRS